MPRLDLADALYLGSAEADAAYLGSVEAWTANGGGGGTFLTPALVNEAQGILTTASVAWTFSGTATAGNALIALFSSSGGSSGNINTITDTAGNVWVKAATAGTSGQGNTFLSMWYAVNVQSPGTISIGSTSNSFQWQLIEFDNVATIGQPDQAPAATTNGTASATPVSTAVTPTIDNALLIAAISYGATATSSLSAASTSAGWQALTNPAAAASKHLRSAWKVQASPSSQQAQWDLDVASTYTGGILSLEPQAA
jgi:hypothetical protein